MSSAWVAVLMSWIVRTFAIEMQHLFDEVVTASAARAQRTAETATRLRTVMRPRGPERYEPAVGATSR